MALLLISFSPAFSSESGYRLEKTIPLSGNGYFDYLTADEIARRLYVTHDTVVHVLDLDSNKLVGNIEGVDHVHGVALARDLNRGYITNGQRSTITCFALDSFKKIGEIPSGKGPDAITYDSVTHRVFAMNGHDGSTTVVNAQTNKVIGTIPLGGAPEFAVTDGKGHLYVNLEDKNQTVRLDTRTMKVIDTWSTAPGDSPSALAIDRKHDLLFIGCRNQKLVILRATDGHPVAVLPIGDHVDAAAFASNQDLIFCSNGDGTLSIIREDSPEKFTETEPVKTERGAKTMALDSKSGNVYLSTAQFGEVPKTPEHHRPKIIPGTFVILKVTR